jgi:hypothetical protein
MSVTGLLAIWKPLAIAGCAGLVIGSGGAWWLRDQMAANAKLDSARKDTKAAVQVIKRTDQAARVTESVGARVEKRAVEIRYITRTLIKEVPVYVTAEADRLYPVPVGAVRLHDLAAQGSAPAIPDGSGEPVDTPSGVAMSAFVATVVDNYGVCREVRGQVIGWQEWYAEQAKAWNAK